MLKKGRRSTFAELAKHEGRSSPFIESEVEHATAFLFGVISDRMMRADKAWRVPFELSKRLKHLDVARIAKMDPSEREEVLRKPKNLHRFNAATARGLIAASKHLVEVHKGSALNM